MGPPAPPLATQKSRIEPVTAMPCADPNHSVK